MKLNSLLVAIPCFQIIFIASVYAQSRSESQGGSLRAQALMENEVGHSGTLSRVQKSSDAQLEGGMLSLKDPRPEVISRTWKYFLDFSLQKFHPEGSAQNTVRNDFNLNDNGTTAMPALAFGFNQPTFADEVFQTNAGIAGKLGYSSQGSQFSYASGFNQGNIRLNTMLISAKPFVGIRFSSLPRLETDLGLEYGTISYMQTSSDDLTSFSQHSSFAGWTAGLNFILNPNMAITTEYSARKILHASDAISIQKDNLELGTRISW